MLTASDEDEILFLALESGADGYLLKHTKPADLRAALLDFMNGGAPMTSEIAEHLTLSIETVRSHLKNTYTKMHVRSRAEAVAHYMSKKPG